MISAGTVVAVAVAVTVLVSIAVVNRSHRTDHRWGDVLRSRLLFGVPWGTLVVVVFVLAVYLFLQDGITEFDAPVTIPYRAWSYFYPLGMVTAPLSHATPSHLTGNLIGTLVAAPIAEYAWGHYPNGRDAETDSWLANPWLRAFVFFPLVAVGVALLTSLFALGPVIGFSGVVFAFVGFAIVHYPIVTIVGVLGVQGALGTIYRAIQNPIVVHVPQASPPGPPSWATIAIQGHALGFFIGLLLGVALLRRRRERPNVLHVWIAVVLYGFSSSLWAIYWFGGQNTYILFRGPGVIVVTVLSLVVALAVAGPDTPIVPRRFSESVGRVIPSVAETTPSLNRITELGLNAGGRSPSTPASADRIRAIATPDSSELLLSDVTAKSASLLAVFMLLALLAGAGIPINLLVLDESAIATESSIEVDDYTVTYAENVENELTGGIPIEQLESDLESSGVIVVSEDRQIWHEAVSAQQLGFSGSETIYIGGPGWREAVQADRTGWTPVGNDTVYQIELAEDGEEGTLAYESNSSQADATIADRTVAVASEDGAFQFEVDDGETTSTTELPAANETTTAGGLTFERDDSTVYTSADGTDVQVARQEQYE